MTINTNHYYQPSASPVSFTNSYATNYQRVIQQLISKTAGGPKFMASETTSVPGHDLRDALRNQAKPTSQLVHLEKRRRISIGYPLVNKHSY